MQVSNSNTDLIQNIITQQMSKPKRAWYYVDLDGAQQGPVDESTLKAEYRTGEVDGMSLLWRPGQKGGWLKLDDLSSLKTRITQASTPSFNASGDGGSSLDLDNTSFGILQTAPVDAADWIFLHCINRPMLLR